MNLAHGLALGFGAVCTLPNLGWLLCGALLGTLAGVLPRVGSVAAIALLLPVVHALDPLAALMLLAAVYYGAQYGASNTAILVHDGAEPTAVAGRSDGYQMARQGRAGAALAVAALASFFAGCVGTLVFAAFAAPLTRLALGFGPTELFSLMLLGLVGSVVLATGSLLKGLAMVTLGLLLSQIGTDPISGVARLGLGLTELGGGVGFTVLAIGLFGGAVSVANLGAPSARREVYRERLRRLWPSARDLRLVWPSVLRGSALGSVLGALPGSGATLSSFASHALEKKLGGEHGSFGKGDIRGIGGPESANNAAAQTSFMPMLALGIPLNAVMALLLGAMLAKGIAPGPQLLMKQPLFFWGVVASMLVGNLMLIVLNWPLAGFWRRLLGLPYRFVFPALTLLGALGVYALQQRTFDVYLSALVAAAGYIFYKLGCEAAPLLLGFVLGAPMELNLRRTLTLAQGDWGSFVTRPVSAALLVAAALLIASVLLPSIRSRRDAAFVDAAFVED